MNNVHLDRVEEMLTRITPEILAIAKRKLRSGAIAVEDFDGDNYTLARIILVSALQDTINQNHPGKQWESELKNLECF
jgi:hypothetical protein